MGIGGYTDDERKKVIAEEKAKIEQERRASKQNMDQREAMIAAIRAQVEKERAEKEAKMQKEQSASQTGPVGGGASSGDKPKFKTLSAEDLQRLEEKKRMKKEGTLSPEEAAKPFEPAKEEPAKVESAEKTVEDGEMSVQQAGDDKLANVGVGGDSLATAASAGDTLTKVSGDSLAGGNLSGGLNITGLGGSVTSINEAGFSTSVEEKKTEWSIDASTTAATPEKVSPTKNIDDDGNLISVVPIKKAAEQQDVKSLYNIDFDEDDSADKNASDQGLEAALAAAEARKVEEAKKAEEERAAQEAKKAEEARKAAEEAEAAKKAEEAKKAAEEAARRDAIEQTKRAEEEARRAAEKTAQKAAEEEAIRKAKEEAAKRKAAEEAKKKAAEEASRKALAGELQAKANTTNRRLESTIQKLIEANNKVATLDDQEKNHAKYVEEALQKITDEAEQKVSAIQDGELERIQSIANQYEMKKQDLDKQHADAEERAKISVEQEKQAKAADIDNVKRSQADKRSALAEQNENNKVNLQKEENTKKQELVQAEADEKQALEQQNVIDKQNLEAVLKQDEQAVMDELQQVKNQVAEADNKIQAAIDHVAELERELENAKLAVEAEKENKVQAESQIAEKEEAVAKFKAKAEARKSELEHGFTEKKQNVESSYVAKKEQLVNDYVAKQNQLVEDYSRQCAELDLETEDLVLKAEQALAAVDTKAETDRQSRLVDLDNKKSELDRQQDEDVQKAKEQTQADIASCREQAEKEKITYQTKANDDVEEVRVQLKTAKDEAASIMQVYEITKRSAQEAMESATRLNVPIEIPSLNIEIPTGEIKEQYKAKAPEKANQVSEETQWTPASEVSVPVSAMMYLNKYYEASQIADAVKVAISEVVASPTGNKNIVVYGKHGFGSTIIGNDFARAYHAAGVCSSKAIANIKAAALNKRPLETVQDKLKGGCLVVENAGSLTAERLSEIVRISGEPANEIVVILTGEKARLQELLKVNNCQGLFAHSVDMTGVDSDGLFSIAKAYISQMGFATDDSGYSVLKGKLKEIEDGNLDRYLKIVDNAIEKTKSKGAGTNIAASDFTE